MIKKILVLPALFFIILQVNSQVCTSYLRQLQQQIYWPSDTTDFGDGHMVKIPFIQQSSKEYQVLLDPFNNPTQDISSLHFVFQYGNDTWNNNNGQYRNINLSNVSKINSENLIDINFYPNPIIDFSNILLNTDYKTDIFITIRDIRGTVIKSTHIGPAKKNRFNNNLAPDIYIFSFTDKISDKTLTKKIVNL